MNRLFPVISLFFITLMVANAQQHHSGPVKWMTFEEAVAKNKTMKKKLFIDVYTDWCGWCKVMDKNTFTDPKIAALLNEKFYPVKFDAEQKEDVSFNGNVFKYISSGGRGTHQLAAALLNNQLSYPTVTFLEEDYMQAYPLPGYRKPEELHSYLVFFAENQHKKGQNSYQEFMKTYRSPYVSNTTKN